MTETSDINPTLDRTTHTPGPWTWHWNKDRDGYADGRIGTDPKSNTLGMSACIAVSPRLVDQPQWEADARLIAAAPDMAAAVRAQHAWSYCEHHGLGTFNQRSVLCCHVDYLNAKALAKMEGRDFDAEYKGARRLVVWPHVDLVESRFDEAEALIAEALAHERAAIAKASA